MMRIAVQLLVAASMASTAAAQPQPPKSHAAMGRAPVYLTLMGEPFRGRAGGPAPVEDWIARADTDRNGTISLAEFIADSRQFHAALDVNKDGRVDGDEIQRYEDVVAPPAVRFAGGLRPPNYHESKTEAAEGISSIEGGAPEGGGGPGPARFAMMGLPQPVANTDSDLNRIVTREEFDRAARNRFKEADKNGDGQLTRDELLPAARHR